MSTRAANQYGCEKVIVVPASVQGWLAPINTKSVPGEANELVSWIRRSGKEETEKEVGGRVTTRT
jgi:hypothetical protein